MGGTGRLAVLMLGMLLVLASVTAPPTVAEEVDDAPRVTSVPDEQIVVAPDAVSTATDRVAGADRYATAAAISRRQFPQAFAPGRGTVYLARGDLLADAMVGGVLRDGPVLLVKSCGPTPSATASEVARLNPARVVALGGPGAVCDDTLTATAAGRPSSRLAGTNRYETAALISRRAFPTSPAAEVYLATGQDSPDPAVGGTLRKGPILLVPGTDAVPAVTRAEIARLAPGTLYSLGGRVSVPDAALAAAADGRPTARLAGADRYATSVAIARHAFPKGARTLYLTRGDVYADAVTSGVLTDGPVLLINAATCGRLPRAVRDYVERTAPDKVVAIGGTASVCAQTLTYAAQIATPGGPRAACLDLAARLSTADRVGQLFMVGKDSTTAADAAYRSMLSSTRTGQVVLFGTTTAGTTRVRAITDSVRAAAVRPSGISVLIAADQEGGSVQRLQGSGFDRIPTATVQGTSSATSLRASAKRWGGQLRSAGVDVDLAPVADVVPPDMVDVNQPIGVLRRYYGTSPSAALPKVRAFAQGMADAGVATSLKHFPGLGHVVGNTDDVADVVDTVVGRDDPGLAVFTGAAAAGADMMMMSTAIYAKIDRANPAAFSRVVIQDLLRGQLGFEGVVVSDDLGAARQVQPIPPGERAVRFLAAGGDVVLNVDPGLQQQMVDAVRARVRSDAAFAWQAQIKAARVLTMKEQHGAASCG